MPAVMQAYFEPLNLIKMEDHVLISADALQHLLNAAHYAAAPYIESEDYGSDHWSHELRSAAFKAAKDVNLNPSNSIMVEH